MKRTRFFLFISISILNFGFSAQAAQIAPKGLNKNLGLLSTLLADIEDYQIGTEWGKKVVTKNTLEKATPEFRRAVKATAKLGGGTGFYLGKFDGRNILATNHHVCPETDDCVDLDAYFPVIGKKIRVTKRFGSWPEIDLSLLEIQVKDEDQKVMSEIAANFAFDYRMLRGTKLLTAGFGVAGNSARALVAAQDRDCIIYSEDDDVRLMADPDKLNPADYKAWSFAHGCDTSHGDSGSAIVDRKTSEVIGIIWTGAIPKSEDAQDEDFLDDLFHEPGEETWEILNYAVPAFKMKEVFLKKLKDGKLDESTASMIKALIAKPKNTTRR